MMNKVIRLSMAVWAAVCFQVELSRADSQLEGLFNREISERNPGFQVELVAAPVWQGLGDSRSVVLNRIAFSGETSPGLYALQVEALKNDGTVELLQSSVGYRVYAQAYVAQTRVMPGQVISPKDFKLEKVNVTTGSLSSLKSLLLPVSTELKGLESNQTIIENQPLLRTAVQKIPDIRKGKQVKIKMIAGEVTLTTRGQVEEPAYLHNKVRVTAVGTRRLLEGVLIEGGIVEVRL